MMDPDDCHYYCCGGCSGLFTTLGALTRHKRSCTGKPNATQCKVFACRSEHHLKLLVKDTCSDACTDAVGDILVNDQQQETTQENGRRVRSARQSAKLLPLTKVTSGTIGKGKKEVEATVTTESSHLNITELSPSDGQLTKKRKRGRPRKTATVLPKETEDGELKTEGPVEQISLTTTAGKSPRRSTPSSVDRILLIGDNCLKNVQNVSDEIELCSKPEEPLRKSKRKANPVEGTEQSLQRAPDEKQRAEMCASESPRKMRAVMDNSDKGKEVCETKMAEDMMDTEAVGLDDVDVALCRQTHSKSGHEAVECLDQAEPAHEIPVASIGSTHAASAFDAMLAVVESLTKKECHCEPDVSCTCGDDPVKECEAENDSLPTFEGPLSAEPNDTMKNPFKPTVIIQGSLSVYDQLSQYRQELEVKDKKGKQTFYICNVCGWKSKHLGFFARHLQCHNGTSSGSVWKCSDCDFTCKKKSALKVHESKHLKPFMCEYCSYCCAAKKDLERHLWTHTGEQPYACPMCNYRCRQHMALTEHMRKHSGDVLRCIVEGCNFTSTYKWALTNHIANKHTLEKRFQCPDCSYGTSDSGSFTKHLKLHQGIKDYKCSQCEYRAVAKHDIVKHMRTHTKEKVYFCDRCKYSTSHSSGLRLHMMSHLGVKPWQCVLCGYNSISKGKVVRHIKQRHQGAAPANVDDAIINLGLKLDIKMSNYRRANENGERIVYDVQQIPASSLDEVQVIVQELPLGADILQVTAESAETILLEHAQAQMDCAGIDAMQLQQFTTANMDDCGDIIITPENVGTLIIPVQST